MINTPLDHCTRGGDLGLVDGARRFDFEDDATLDGDDVVLAQAKKAALVIVPVHCAARSAGDTNFGTTSVAVPNAVTSSRTR